MDNNIEKAKTLYESKDYDSAFEICLELLKKGECKKDGFLLAAKCFLFMLNDPKDTDSHNTWLNAFKNACEEAETIEEALELECEMTKTFYEWKAENFPKQLAILENNPSLEQYGEYLGILPKYAELDLYISTYARNCYAVNTYCEEIGIEKKELHNKIKEQFGDKFKAPEIITDEGIQFLEFEAAQRIFVNIQNKLAENNTGSIDFIKRYSDVIRCEFLTVELLVDFLLREKEISPDVRYERLMLLANILSYYLSALIYLNGKPASLFMGSAREKKVEKLKKVYGEIKELDPSFEVPVIPNIAAVEPSSGGCYVATAVYGSYDCPEVWTLRRYRDYTLGSTWHGRAFIKTYYAISPTLVRWFGNAEWFKNMWKPTLDRMVKKLNDNGVDNTAYNDKEW